MATKFHPPLRTQGDGMERVDNNSSTEQTIVLCPQDLQELTISSDVTEKRMTKHKIIRNFGSAIKLTPQTIDKRKKDILSSLKNKEPKFVPYEPYKAAVRPIVPGTKKTIFHQSVKKKSKDFANIFNPQKKLNVVEEKDEKIDGSEQKEVKDCLEVDWREKLKALESENQTLREENSQLEKQLKFQVQVNGELKNLLVAAVGEDMETKVHVLTEDKLHLAQALLHSAESLTTHQEQTEWLAGQCEVWRSKFLASSVMVEELARWKASLSQKVNEAHDVLRKLLEDGKQISSHVLKTHRNLCQLRDNFDLHSRKNNLTSYTVIDISAENLKISEALLSQLLGTDKKSIQYSYLGNSKKTATEKTAEHILASPNVLQLIGAPDVACNAVVGAAVTLSGQLYLQNHPPKIKCCRKCSGEIKLV